MHTSKLAKQILKILPFLVVIVFAVAGLFIAKNVYRTPVSTPELPKVIETLGPCASGIYMSLPPKCKTLDGNFISVPEGSSNFFVIPGPK